jgi:hypothetical protein
MGFLSCQITASTPGKRLARERPPHGVVITFLFEHALLQQFS